MVATPLQGRWGVTSIVYDHARTTTSLRATVYTLLSWCVHYIYIMLIFPVLHMSCQGIINIVVVANTWCSKHLVAKYHNIWIVT